MNMFSKAFILLMVLSVSSGCALTRTAYVPDDYSPSQELKCTDNSDYVVFDFIAGLGISIVPTIVIVGTDGASKDEKLTVTPFLLVGSLLMLTAGIVAEQDYIQDCKHAKITRRGWIDRSAIDTGQDSNEAEVGMSERTEHPVNKSAISRSEAELVGVVVPAGTAKGDCYGNGTCNSGLKCNSSSICEARSVPAGNEAGVCYGNGTCNDELECIDGTCVDTNPPAIGTIGGACYENGTCDDDLACDEILKLCVLARYKLKSSGTEAEGN